MSELILKAEHLTKRYKTGRGAIDVSFELEKGTTFGLLGANGAGKTTVMKILTGLCHPDSGDLSIMGYNVEEYPEKAKRLMASLIESPAFYPYLSAYQNLKLASMFYRNPDLNDHTIDEILEQVDLLHYKNEKTAGFSLGMKQRLGLALTMISSPSLYILDEPSNGLDIEGRVDIRNIIIRLAKRGDASFIISSHLSEEIQKTCSVVGIMKDSKLLTIEKMDTILSNYPSLEAYYLQKIGKTEEVYQ